MTDKERLAKIAALVEKASERSGPVYLDAAEVLGVYLLASGGVRGPAQP